MQSLEFDIALILEKSQSTYVSKLRGQLGNILML